MLPSINTYDCLHIEIMIELEEKNIIIDSQYLQEAPPSPKIIITPSSVDSDTKVLYNDLPRIISDVLNYMGRYQIALFIALAMNGLIYGINHTLTAFHIYTPKFHCDVSTQKV